MPSRSCSNDHALRGELRELLEACSDMQRLTTRASHGTGHAAGSGRDRRARCGILPKFKAKLAGRKSQLLARPRNAGSNSAPISANCSTAA